MAQSKKSDSKNPKGTESPKKSRDAKDSKSAKDTEGAKKSKGSRDSKKSESSKDPKRSGNPAKAAAAMKEKQESRSAANRVSRVPVKVKRTGSPNWYAPTMVTLMVIGLLWVVTTYLFKGTYPLPYFQSHHANDWLANGNLYVGFLVMMLGFLGLLRWK